MSSTLLIFDNDYRFPPAPAKAVLDRATWNAVMADLAAKMRAVLAKGTELEDLVSDLSFNGQARIDEAITPLIVQVQADLSALALEVAATLAANQSIIDNFQAVTAVNLAELEDKITEVEQRIAVILAGGIDAADVAESTTRVFVTPEQRDAIPATVAALTELQQSTIDAFAIEAAARANAITTEAAARMTGFAALRRYASSYALTFGG